MRLVVRAAVGAVVVSIITLLSRTRHVAMAGLVPLFPTFTLIAHIIVGTERTTGELRQTIVLGTLAVIPYLGYMGSLYLLLDRVRLGWALTGATLTWLLMAAVLLVLWQRMTIG